MSRHADHPAAAGRRGSGGPASGGRPRKAPRRLLAVALAFGASFLALPPTPAQAASPSAQNQPSPSALLVKYTTRFTESYSDKGSSGTYHLDVWRPGHSAGWFQLGDVAMDEYGRQPSYALLVKPPADDDPGYPALRQPASFTEAWKDQGSGVEVHGSLWHAVAPTYNGHKYTCLGDIAEQGYARPNPNDDSLKYMRCVRSDWVDQVESQALWKDVGSRADQNGSVFGVAPQHLTDMDAPTFEAETGYQPGPFEQYQALDVRHAAFGTKQPPLGEPDDGPLASHWTDDDAKSDQVMYKASLEPGENTLGYPRYTGIPGWVVRLYCRRAGVGTKPGQCAFHGVGEETRVKSDLVMGKRISDREILNCTATGSVTDTLTWSYATTDTYTFTQSFGLQFPLGFTVTPFDFQFEFETTWSEQQQWAWASGSTSTKTTSHAYSAAPGMAAWIAKVSNYGQMQGIAYITVNDGINWRNFTSADRDLDNGAIKSLISVTNAETKKNNGYEPVTGPGGASDFIPVAVNMTGDLPELGSANVARGPGIALVERPLSDKELQTCAGLDWQRVKDARDAKYPNLALGKPTTATSHDTGHDSGDAVDGNTRTYWKSDSAADGSPQSITVDLGTPQRVSRLVLKLPPNFSDRSEPIDVSGGNDGITWTSLLTLTGVFEPGTRDTATLVLDPDNATWRRLRITFTGNSGSGHADHYQAQLAELEAYAS